MLLYHFGYGEDRATIRRGKRLRPQIAMRTALAEAAPLERVLDAAAAVEILHNYSLVHDDIEDRDELRHGRRTLWNVYGVAQAINAGDAMCAISFLTLARASEHLEGARVLEMVRTLHEAHRVMCEGQALDLQFEGATHVDLDAYHHMIACKTGALFEASFVLGAQAAGATDRAVEGYAELGRAYGRAFQIRDDVLGIWASSDATGKVSGNDLARRKWTFPVVWALAQPASPARSVVATAYAAGRALEPTEVERVVEALVSLGAQQAAARAIAEPMAVVERHPSAALREYLLGTLV
ncbi:MAG: polyprenyl synthetase family protein [bacterium]|nr:polyprenyl synthetase family protein [bacterium]